MKRHVAGDGREECKALGRLRGDRMQLIQARQRELVGQRPVAQLGAFVAQVACIQKFVESVERFLRPIPGEGRVDAKSFIAPGVKQREQGGPLGGEQQIMHDGVTGVDAREQRQLRQLRAPAKCGGCHKRRRHLHAR